jgi:oligoribonuclease NrnB/cAMP/cGMP phosphodiesterase (DHH superfamily)
MKPIYDYVIYHKKCLDGFTGFVILTKTHTIKKSAIIYPDVPSARSLPPNIDNKNIIIIDVAYKYEVLRDIVNRAKHVTFLDHHITILDDVEKIKQLNRNKIEVIYDKYKSGATLTWNYFFKNKKAPLFVRYIEDNDIGKWEMKYCLEFITGLSVHYDPTPTHNNLKEWSKLFSKTEVKRIIKLGTIYSVYKNYLADEHSKRFSLERFPSQQIYDKYSEYFTKPGQYTVALYCGSPCPSTNDISKRILEQYKCDFFVSWVLNLDRREIVLTFRSKVVDVGNIAKIFNGGGHTLASAGSFKYDEMKIEDLFLGTSIVRESRLK